MPTYLLAVFLCLSILSGCSRTETKLPEKQIKKGEKVLAIGLIPEENIFRQAERYEPLAGYLSEKTGMRVEMKVLPRYGDVVADFVSSGLDGAFFGSFTYALAHAKLGIVPLARPERLDGVSSYRGFIFARKDSGIRSVMDMKGKRFAFVDKTTTAGYLLPLQYFSEHGVKNYRTYLKEVYFAGSHEDAIEDVVSKRADIGAAKNTVYDRLAKKDGRIRSDLVVLAQSPEVPENGLSVRKDLDSSLRERLKEVLLNMHNDAEGKRVLQSLEARKFIETTDRDYEPLYRYARELNIDLATYDHVNE